MPVSTDEALDDVFGHALYDHYKRCLPFQLWIHNKYGPKEEMPVEAFFRGLDEMPELEMIALNQCRGRVLDIGAGAGSHALMLQQRGFKVTAIDISALAVKVMTERGVANALQVDVFNYHVSTYDTLLLLMNGMGLCGTLDGLRLFLNHAKTLLKPGGQLLFDSSDVAYLYEDAMPDEPAYYGEIKYQYEYKYQKTEWFNWLYVDTQTLATIALTCGWNTEILFDDGYDQYLARLKVAG